MNVLNLNEPRKEPVDTPSGTQRSQDLREGFARKAAAILLIVLAGCATNGSRPRAKATVPTTVTSVIHAVDPIPISVNDCLARPPALRSILTGVIPGPYRVDRPTTDAVFDARAATFTGDGETLAGSSEPMIYPILLAKAKPTSGLCFIGGSVPGTLSRSMTWPQLKAEVPQPDGRRVYFDAPALTEFSSGDAGHLVDGLRVDDVSDGIAARGSFAITRTPPLDGGNFYLRNAYFTSVHDDCVDINDLVSGIVSDSLLDGCYTGISERPDSSSPLRKYSAPAGQQFTLDHVLLRMAGFPGPHPTRLCPSGTASGYNEPFKWSPNANSLVVRHSILLLDRPPCSDRYFPFPKHTTLDDVTIVWTGHGHWRWHRPRGVLITTDGAVWRRARQAWLDRHGCTNTTPDAAATTNLCTRLTNPTPS